MRHALRAFRHARLPAGLTLASVAAALLATGATLPVAGDEPAGPRPVVAAAALAREYRDDPAAAERHRIHRVRVRVDRVSEEGFQVRVDQDPVGDDPGVIAHVPLNDRGRVRPGDSVVVWAFARGYAGGRLELGTAVPE
jgi:hypothetical protein